jgi:hypothetical protein
MKRIEQGLRPPLLPVSAGLEADGPESPGDILTAQLDDATTSYVVNTRVPFDLMRQANGQLAGLLVLAASGGRSAQDHPMLHLAEECLREALDGIRGIRPPPQAEHHHLHLLEAARAIRLALRMARERLHQRDDASMDAIMEPLRAGFRQLQWAAGALPGFEIVAFEQGCCASHPAIRRPDDRETGSRPTKP